MARNLTIEIIGDDRSYRRALDRSGRSTGGFTSSLGRLAKAGAFAAGAAGIGALVVTLKQGFQEISDSQKVLAQTNAVLKSTGGIANVTAKHVDELATAQSRLTGIDDELIATGENLLLTFKNVRNEVGRGNAVFDRATKSALDLSTAGFGSVESASKMLGKALNDPIRGMTALSRAGVTFSAAQKETIKGLVETGHALDAQKLILKEVESQVGGSAAAYGETLPGQLAKAKNSFDEVAGQLTMSLLPAVTKSLDGFNRFLVFVQENMPKWKAAVVENTKPVIEILTRVWSWIQMNLLPIFRQMAAVAVTEWTKIASIFQKHGPEIRRIIERITAVVEPLIKAWLFLAQNVVIPIIKPLFTVIIPAALLATIVVLDKATAAIESVINVFKWLATNAGKLMGKMLSGITAPLEGAIGLFERLALIIEHVRGAVLNVLDQIANIKLPSLPRLGGLIPGRQHGGPVKAGSPYIVGERGPEMFVPSSSGNIIPNGGGSARAVGGGGGGGVTVNVYGNLLTSKRELEDMVRGALNDVARRNPGTGLAF